MKIREGFPIQDRVKLITILLLVLFAVIFLLCLTKESEKKEQEKSASINRFLKVALEPVGSTMYIWGGGWNDEDKESGAGSTKVGLSSQWRTFAEQQDATYDFKEHRFERENGLDCSGYVGWVVYNTFETKDNRPGYVTTSTDLAKSLANRGWGVLIHNPNEFLPGDVVSMEGHVWICLGTCEDGSVLLVHSSPPGVSVCGTPRKAEKGEEEGQESIAVQIATEYMTTHHPKWQEKYPNRTASASYLENVSVFRWNTNKMIDAEEMQALSAETIMGAIIE